MAQLGFFVDPSEASEAPVREFDNAPVPVGWYDVEIRAADIVPTKTGGHRINVRYGITGPTQAGRVVFGSMNIDHPNEEVVRIAKDQLAQIAKAIGKRFDDTDQLIGQTLGAYIIIRKQDGYPDANDIRAWRKSGSSIGSSASPNKPSGSTPPWVKK